jgi:hypothetical protein
MSNDNSGGGPVPAKPGGYIRRYPDDYSGICVLIAESNDGPIKSTVVTREIIRLCGDSFMKAVQLARNKMKIFMRNPKACNDLVKAGLKDVTLTIPQRLIECIGVCYIHPDITDDDLMDLKSFEKKKLYQLINPKVISACRINKQPGQWTVTITFAGKKLPSHVELDRCLFPVREYYYPVRQCFVCWRFGHSAKQCKSAKRCAKCGKSHDNEEAYKNCGEAVRCVHCNGNHPSNDKNCEVHKKKARENKEKQEAGKENSHSDVWACFSQGVVDKQVPQDNPLVSFEIPETPEKSVQEVQNKKRKNSTTSEDDVEPDNDFRTFQINIDEIVHCASQIVIGLRTKDDMAQLIASQLSASQEGGGGGPALRL